LTISEGEVEKLSAELFNGMEQLNELEKKVNDYTISVSTYQTKITANAKRKQALLESKNEKDKLDAELRNQDSLFSRINSELSQLKKDYLANKENIKRVTTELESNKATIQEGFWRIEDSHRKVAIVDFWKDGLSYKGVKSLLLDGFCNEFNTLLKEYISEISSGVMSIEFSPISQTKSGESRNKLDLVIEIADIKRNYDGLSGGEKRRIDIAVCLAFSAWIRQRFNLKSSLLGIMILDEVMSFLDSSAEDCIAPILQQEALNKAVFVISHTKELSTYCDKVITVKKENMVSRII
jgi:DNA repair exonuclease SbcCD ATPase subunit